MELKLSVKFISDSTKLILSNSLPVTTLMSIVHLPWLKAMCDPKEPTNERVGVLCKATLHDIDFVLQT